MSQGDRIVTSNCGDSENSPQSVLSKQVEEHDVSSSKQFSEQAQQLISQVNVKRKRDSDMLQDFKEKLEGQAMSAFAAVESSMMGKYTVTGQQIESRMQQLSATLKRISTLETELNDFKGSLGSFYKDILN